MSAEPRLLELREEFTLKISVKEHTLTNFTFLYRFDLHQHEILESLSQWLRELATLAYGQSLITYTQVG